ncbi:SDR family oxidoreductase [Solimonas sp. SE-A11]|uniref:SDR family oxidoreductase n=1 Tax=Solimonas sp. SE-A11 TaxID=3054954 RepID=UPI00259C893D|nr:SDR family oxidoreductase [Solimonas sp. SE-A11]MDM4770369.1 SDR family oxidoreductase [Solimonas sp. SE-A11]
MQQRIFITGGASGLGRALAERYAREGWRVCVADIDPARGAETVASLAQYGGGGHYLNCDVRREADLQAAADWLQYHWGGIDVVVNNAGVAVAGGIGELPMRDWEWITDINLLGVARGCKVFTPLFRAQGRGYFINVASMAGLIHPPKMAAYCATKAAVVALSEVLAVELATDRIGVSVVCPDFFRTNLADSLRASDDQVAALTRKLVTRARVGADEIADQVFDGVAQGRFRIVTHRRGYVAWMAKRLLPWRAFSAAVRREAGRMMAPRRAR